MLILNFLWPIVHSYEEQSHLHVLIFTAVTTVSSSNAGSTVMPSTTAITERSSTYLLESTTKMDVAQTPGDTLAVTTGTAIVFSKTTSSSTTSGM